MEPAYRWSDSLLFAFPTPILRRRFDDARTNEGLKGTILAREKSEAGIRRSLYGGWHSQDDLLNWPGPEIATFATWTAQAIQEMTGFVMTELSQGPAFNVKLDGGAWANVVRDGSYHKIHNHPNCDWSGVYYVDIGTPDPAAPSENGMIEFLDPRMGVTQPGTEGPRGLPKLQITPEPGLMLIFPSWLYHYVSPFRGSGERISIAFNITLRFTPA